MKLEVERLVLGELETNCYILNWGGEAAVIDPGADEEQLLERLAGQRVRYILLTHGHPDHLGGAPRLKREFPQAELLLHGADLDGLRWFLPDLEPDGLLEEGTLIALGKDGESLRVLHTPGHSPGSVVFLADERLFVGDLLFSGSIGRTDLPGGSQEAMDRSLRRIMELDGDFLIHPGHGPETTLARERISNPFLRELQVRWPPERS
ncbi:MAG: MBL fold metallo-hydrolase [Candidatus Acetothermia bacterium]|jgi:glyoxylase-like metal-dependent hydrolase (beta-lactamase superfamily II)|nr:MBL fold metallo-hydrolase [Candidatus Acetothermia bacterium]MDH7505217.1 MBL fold metallo-hydrolase [Candidatus Acetothermia bacterium]